MHSLEDEGTRTEQAHACASAQASTPSARVQLERAYTELKPLLDGLGPSPAGAPEAGGEA